MPITTINFRGKSVEVGYHDHGYDPDTNSHGIEWWFENTDDDDVVTQEEDEEIVRQLEQRSWEDDE